MDGHLQSTGGPSYKVVSTLFITLNRSYDIVSFGFFAKGTFVNDVKQLVGWWMDSHFLHEQDILVTGIVASLEN